jgi:hypothetical protein
LKIARRLLQKQLGFRMLLDAIPLDARLIKGSHGKQSADEMDWPVLITGRTELFGTTRIESTAVLLVLMRQILAS